MNCDPASLAAAARCLCFPGHLDDCVRTYLICQFADRGMCSDVPADLVPVLLPVYDDGELVTLSIRLPAVCCQPDQIIVYEADDAEGTGATLYHALDVDASHAGEADYVVAMNVLVAPTKAYLIATQSCADSGESDFSNGVDVIQNMMPEGARYDVNDEYDFQPLLSPGGTYRLINLSGPEQPVYLTYTGYHAIIPAATSIEFVAEDSGMHLEAAPGSFGTLVGFRLELVTPPLPVISEATAWSNRVVVNGGTAPGWRTMQGASTFIDALKTAGVWTKMKTLNFFAPDNLTAAITPLVATVGLDPWTNHNFVLADLNINGLKGNGTNKYLETGVNPNTHMDGLNGGASEYYFPPLWLAGIDLGAANAGASRVLYIAADISGLHLFQYPENSLCPGNPAMNANGFSSGSRRANNIFNIYSADEAVAFNERQSDVDVVTATRPAVAAYAFAENRDGTGPLTYSARRLSFLAIHEGLTSAETEALYNAVRALRDFIGGGLAPVCRDTLDSYTAGEDLNGKNGGANATSGTAHFTGAYVVHTT